MRGLFDAVGQSRIVSTRRTTFSRKTAREERKPASGRGRSRCHGIGESRSGARTRPRTKTLRWGLKLNRTP